MKNLASILFLVIFLVPGIKSQSILATSGDYFENDDISLSWTLGEPVTETLASTSFILTQGFQQSKLTLVGIKDLNNQDDYEISLYPNPAQNFINIKTSKFEHLNYSISDINGKLLKEVNAVSEQTELSVNELPASIYIIEIRDNKKLVRTYKLIKQ